MKKGFEYFDAIYCINLKYRKDRWQHCVEQFEKYNIPNVIKFDGIVHEDGNIGKLLSHFEILKIARLNGLNNVLILEDDFEVIEENLKFLKKGINELPDDWELFYLSAKVPNNIKQYSKNLSTLTNGLCTHSIAYNSNIFFNVILNAKKTTNYDNYIKDNIQTRNKSFIVNNIITTQRENYSNIQLDVFNHNITDIKKKIT